jgi:3-hydroxyisobutyrate dehydrogenase-like beta-hydroxyacid dehydrogenase
MMKILSKGKMRIIEKGPLRGIGIIGLGRMGRPIAENLLRKGFQVTIFARKKTIQEEMKTLGADVVLSPAELAERTEIIVLAVTDSHAVGEMLFEQNGIVMTAAKGTVIVDITTSDPRVSIKYAKRLARRGIEYLDAPMSGGVSGARAAQLLFMVGGKQNVYERCIPLFEAIGKRSIYIGETGNGHLIKLIHNQAALSIFVATCEAVILGEKLGLSMERMIEVFNQGNARSYTSEVRFPKFILSKTYDMGGSFANQYKDLSLVKKIGKMAGVKLPITDCAYRYFKYVMDKGESEEDFSKIILEMKEILVK